MNETLQAIAKRFACRDFSDQMPSDADLQAIALAAVQAPSGMNRQPWQVIVLKNKQIIAEMEAEGMRLLSEMEDQTPLERIQSRGGKLFYNAPCMIIVAAKESIPKGSEWMDCGILAQNAVLAATSLGIDSLHCGMVKMAFTQNSGIDLKHKLKFNEGYECAIGILLGYANKQGVPHDPDLSKITVID